MKLEDFRLKIEGTVSTERSSCSLCFHPNLALFSLNNSRSTERWQRDSSSQ